MSAMNISWLPSGRTSLTLHSSETGHSATEGAPTFTDGAAVRLQTSNFCISLPLFTPQKSTMRIRYELGRLMTNSPVSLMSACECREGRTET